MDIHIFNTTSTLSLGAAADLIPELVGFLIPGMYLVVMILAARFFLAMSRDPELSGLYRVCPLCKWKIHVNSEVGKYPLLSGLYISNWDILIPF